MSRKKTNGTDYMGSEEQIIQLGNDLPEPELARALLTTMRESLVILDGQMRIRWANASFYTNFGLKEEETEGRPIYEVAEGQWNIGKVRELFDKVIQGRGRVTGHKVAHHFKGVGHRALDINASTIFSESGDPQLIVLSIEDITESASKGEDRERLLKEVRERAVHLEKAKEELRSEILEQLEQNNVMVQAQEEVEKSEEDRAAELVVAKELIKEEIIEHRETEDELRETGRTVQKLSSKLLSAIENERKSIAMELHDSIGANLTAIIYGLEEMLTEARQDQAAELEDLISMARATVEEARRISTNLMPSMLDDLGLLATLRWFCRQFEQLHGGVDIELQLHVEEEEVAEQLKIVTYRILQEALNNIAKHSQADSVQVSLSRTGGTLELYIQDNGRGFDYREYAVKEDSIGGLGIESMRERTEISGGFFEIVSEPGQGTTIRARWPSPG